jgi:phosphate transport system substrate-binding protein
MTDAPGENAYPIAATAFVLMHKTPKNAAHSKSALKFFRWALENGQKLATDLDYVPLPPGLVAQIEAYWKSQYPSVN